MTTSVANLRTSQLMRTREVDLVRLAQYLGLDPEGKSHEELAAEIREHCNGDGDPQ